MTAAELRALAPRLCKAWEQQRALAPILRERLMRKERLVAHRELQLERARANGKARRQRSYIAQREAKLHQARRELRKAQEAA